MKVRLIQSGGLLGIVKACELDSSVLGHEAAGELERLVRGSGISASGAHLSQTGRDLHQYEITIEDETGTLSIVFDDATIPPAAKPMVGFLKRHARPQAPG
jgi:hypothetical protein